MGLPLRVLGDELVLEDFAGRQALEDARRGADDATRVVGREGTIGSPFGEEDFRPRIPILRRAVCPRAARAGRVQEESQHVRQRVLPLARPEQAGCRQPHGVEDRRPAAHRLLRSVMRDPGTEHRGGGADGVDLALGPGPRPARVVQAQVAVPRPIDDDRGDDDE